MPGRLSASIATLLCLAALVSALGGAEASIGPAPVVGSDPVAKLGLVRETIAHRILKLEAEVRPVDPGVVEVLDVVLNDVCAAVRQVPRGRPEGWDPHYAEAVLRRIDTALIGHGFLYPDSGAADLLAECLTPFRVDSARRQALQWRSENQRRRPLIAQRYPGPFYALDCDTASFLYLSVAERLGLPLSLVVIPSRDRRAGHALVRWREDGRSVNWETNDGAIRSDEFYIKSWTISPAAMRARSAMFDLSADQALGCAHYLLGVRQQRQGDFNQALRQFRRALELHPENLDARREFAWVTATGPDVASRDHDAALQHVLRVLEVMEDPDARDTLAAVYASAGRFEQAIREERKAIRDSSTSARAGYRHRLKLYEQGQVYRVSKPARLGR